MTTLLAGAVACSLVAAASPDSRLSQPSSVAERVLPAPQHVVSAGAQGRQDISEPPVGAAILGILAEGGQEHRPPAWRNPQAFARPSPDRDYFAPTPATPDDEPREQRPI